jgi:hypothetical protein
MNLELLAVSLTPALTLGGVVRASVLIGERRDRLAREQARHAGTTAQKG